MRRWILSAGWWNCGRKLSLCSVSTSSECARPKDNASCLSASSLPSPTSFMYRIVLYFFFEWQLFGIYISSGKKTFLHIASTSSVGSYIQIRYCFSLHNLCTDFQTITYKRYPNKVKLVPHRPGLLILTAYIEMLASKACPFGDIR